MRGFALVLTRLVVVCGLVVGAAVQAQTAMPHMEQRDGRHALVVDGKPFLMLGAQINNSNSWASELPEVWPALADIHANTMEAPVYWEQMEPQPGVFDFSGVDLLVKGAREHGLRVVLLWFGTWKNGQNHYVPAWMKEDTKTYPRELNAYGKVLDVMSPNSAANLAADKRAFAALMKHVREVDGAEHTVVMIQVENESGSVGAVRDYSPEATRQFQQDVPKELGHGSWSKVFGADADESFAAWSTATYIGDVAKAGKREYALPMYCNVWITYPVHALENRDKASAGQEYPSGGPQQQNIAIWKKAAPAIDVLGFDFYSDDRALFREVVSAYERPDNALFIPETHIAADFGPNFFYALGHGAIGFSPFGIDYTGWTKWEKVPEFMSKDFALLGPIEREVAAWNFAGTMQTAVEVKGSPRAVLHFGEVEAVVSFGYPQHDGAVPPGTSDASGRALVAQVGPDEFVATGFDASVSFVPADKSHDQVEILRAEEGSYRNGVWTMSRIWNGDQTDRGLQFHGENKAVVKVRLHRLVKMMALDGK